MELTRILSGEGLARLDFGGALAWAEDWDAEFLEMVHDGLTASGASGPTTARSMPSVFW